MQLVPSNDPILHRPAKSVDLADLPNLTATISELQQQMTISGGIGLSANQVGLDLAMFVMEWVGEKRVCINPVVIETSEEIGSEDEGCLSFPELRLTIKRPLWAIVGWFDETGEARKTKLVGLEARVFLHEWDHLQGICFTDRVGKVTLMMAKKRAEKLARRKK